MSRRGWSEVKDLFRAVIEMPQEERREALGNAEPEVRMEVEALLEAHEQAERSEREDNFSVEGPGSQVGRYKLLQEIGSGGFGVVFMAEQKEPVRRRVALKIIKRGMDTDQVVARFEAERQALAMMDHPHIAKILDGGATDMGRPYFVMELVKGVPITEYCDQAALTTAERLELFAQVCHAVQHAHLKGIIHRDLKPGNVLVTLNDGKPVPKVIDFGIAKATNRHLTEKTLFTEFRQMIGTPEYMAPEQAEMSSLDVDTRADIYSLGVMLYELLTGTKPFDLKSLLEKGYQEILRTIREVEPPKPSTRVSTMGDEISTVARNRHTPPKMLGRMIRGDLDWIVMKALEKDRSRRYDTASAFAADIVRHLTDQPVVAGPPGRLYRFGKYVRRHRVGVAATAVVLLALVAGLAAAVLGLTQARQAERRTAEQRDLAQAAAEREARERVRAEAGETRAKQGEARAAASLNLIRGMLGAANPYLVPDPNYRVRDLLDDMSTQLAARLPEEPEVEAVVLQVLGMSYTALGLYDKAEPHLARMIEIYRAAPCADPIETAVAQGHWARYLSHRGRTREALTCAQESLRVLRREFGDAHPDVVYCLLCISGCLKGLDRYSEAEEAAREALAICEARDGGEDSDIAACLQLLAAAIHERGSWTDAAELDHRAWEITRRIYGDGHPATLCARISANLSRIDGAPLDEVPAIEAELLDALAGVRRILGEDHPIACSALRALGNLHKSVGRYGPAEEAYREALAIARQIHGDRYFSVNNLLRPLVEVLLLSGKLEEADEMSRELLNLARELDGGRGPTIADALFHRARVLNSRGRGPEARDLAEEALRRCREAGTAPPSVTANVLYALGEIHRSAGALDEAERCFREGLDTRRAQYRGAHPSLCAFLTCLASVEERRGRLAEAVNLRRESYDLLRGALGEGHPHTLAEMAQLGGALYRAGRCAEGEKLIEGARAAVGAAFGPDHSLTKLIHLELGGMRLAQGDAIAAEEHLQRALEWPRKSDSPAALGAMSKLIEAQLSLGKLADAEVLCREALALAIERYGEFHPGTAGCRLNGARILMHKGQLTEAERQTKRILDIPPGADGQLAWVRVHALVLLGELQCAKQDFSGAERSYGEAAEFHRSVCGTFHPYQLMPLIGVAYSRLGQGNLEGARVTARRVLRLARESLCERSYAAAMAHALLGMVEINEGKREAAESHLRRAVALFDDLLGPENCQSALPRAELGWLLFLQGDERFKKGECKSAIEVLTEGEGFLRRALDGMELPPFRNFAGAVAHREAVTRILARLLCRRGRCHRRLEDWEASDRDIRAALHLAYSLWGKEHNSTLGIELNLCINFKETGRFAASERLARECLPRARKLLAPVATDSYLDLSTFLALLGMSLLPQERWEEAEVFLSECLKLRAEHAPEAWFRYASQSRLGECLVGQGRFAEAERLLLEGYRGMAQRKSPARYLRKALLRLVSLYEMWGKQEKAEEWRSKVSETVGQDD